MFAPTDAAFARLSPAELARFSDAAGARALVARHVLPGTLYSAGMRYYQLRNSMEDAKPLTLQKNSGESELLIMISNDIECDHTFAIFSENVII